MFEAANGGTDEVAGVAGLVTEVGAAVDRLAREIDPELVPASAAIDLVAALAHTERQLAGVKLRLAGRVAETQLWRRRGHRSAAHWLADQSKSSVAEAASVLDAAARLPALPATCDAVREGSLSRGQVVAIADAATVAPQAETELLALAPRESLKALQEAAARRKVAHLDEQERHEQVRASRHVRYGYEPDGAATMSVRATADAMAEIRAAIAHFQDRAFDQARVEGRREPFEAYAVDGLVAMARSALGGGDAPKRLPTKVIVRVDHTALERGPPSRRRGVRGHRRRTVARD